MQYVDGLLMFSWFYVIYALVLFRAGYLALGPSQSVYAANKANLNDTEYNQRMPTPSIRIFPRPFLLTETSYTRTGVRV